MTSEFEGELPAEIDNEEVYVKLKNPEKVEGMAVIVTTDERTSIGVGGSISGVGRVTLSMIDECVAHWIERGKCKTYSDGIRILVGMIFAMDKVFGGEVKENDVC